MDKCRYYRVADHIFSVIVPEEWDTILTNYAPFVCMGGDELFTLKVQNGLVKEERLNHVFTDKSDEDMPRIEVYKKEDDGWQLNISMYRDSEVVCNLLTNADFTKATLYIGTEDVRFAIDNATMLLFAFVTVHQMTLELHASVIKKEGKAYIFLGKSGTGKSTHSRQWLHAFEDAELLNDDNPILRMIEDDGKLKVNVYGSPWSGKTACYKNDSAAVQAIIKLSQAPKNELRPLRLPEAYAYMLSSTSGLKILPETMDALYNSISTLIQAVPVYGLDCLPNTDAAITCYHGTQSCK